MSGLIERIESGHGRFKALLNELTPEQMIEPGVIGPWSTRDIVAHIAVHMDLMSAWVAKRLRGEAPAGPQPYNAPEDELAEINDRICWENRDRPLIQVLAHMESSHRGALALVLTTVDEDLFDPSRFQLRDGEPLWAAVAANTYEHYEEHAHDIRSWLDGR